MDPVSDTAYQRLIVAELGDPENVLAPQIGTLWSLYPEWAAVPYLRYLRTKLHAITLLQGSVRTQITLSVQGDVKLSLGELSTNLERLYTETEAALNTAIQQAQGGGRAGDLTHTEAPGAVPVNGANVLRRWVGW